MADQFCKHCGAALEGDARFCPKCGKPVLEAAETSGFQESSQDREAPTAATAKSTPPTVPVNGQETASSDSPVSNGPVPSASSAPGRSGSSSFLHSPAFIVIVVAVAVIVVALFVTKPWAADAPDSAGDAGATSAQSAVTSSSASVRDDDADDRYDDDDDDADDRYDDDDDDADDRDDDDADDVATNYKLKVKTADGKTLSGTVHRDDDDEVVSDVMEDRYTTKQLRRMNLNDAELFIALNEPLAHMGQHFGNKAVQDYFDSCEWYTDKGLKSVNLPTVAKENRQKIAKLIDERGSAYQWDKVALN